MKTLILTLALAGSLMAQDAAKQIPDPPAAATKPNPELDAANKKIAELTAQLAQVRILTSFYQGDYNSCHDNLAQVSTVLYSLQHPDKSAK